MPLAYNSALTYKKHIHEFHPKVLAKYEKLGVATVSDFIDIYDDLTDTQKLSLGANHIMEKMPNEWVTQVDSQTFGDMPSIETLLSGEHSVHACYMLLMQLRTPVSILAFTKWESDFECTNLLQEWPRITKIFNQNVSIKLQSFYLRYIYRTVVTNYRRSKWNPSNSPLCTNCGTCDKTFLHIFWDCSKVQPLWSKLIEWCKTVVDPHATYSKQNCLLFGFKSHLLNMIMTICKYHIHLLRLFDMSYDFDELINRICNICARDVNAYKRLPYLKSYKMISIWKPVLKLRPK